jgi:hypothetical protein
LFVDQLELLVLGFEAVDAKLTGRPGYHLATMPTLYIFGFLNRIQSPLSLLVQMKLRRVSPRLLY